MGKPKNFTGVKAPRTHGRSYSPEWHAWAAMIQRCENETHRFWYRYGGRGISVCKRWRESFAAFFEDVGARPGKGYSLDRYPKPDGNYEPGNVRWATQRQQMRNQSSNLHLTLNGVTKTLCEWSESTGIHRATIQHRLRKGWPVDMALTIQTGSKEASSASKTLGIDKRATNSGRRKPLKEKPDADSEE